jgi:hypothetical protein
MRYYSAKGIIMPVSVCGVGLIAVLSLVNKTYPAFCITAIAFIYLIWTLFDTFYTVDGNTLGYRSALINGTIPIDSITQVVKNKKMYSGLKPALSTKGVIVKYNKYDDIYLSPKDIDLFIDALRAVNPGIAVSN